MCGVVAQTDVGTPSDGVGHVSGKRDRTGSKHAEPANVRGKIDVSFWVKHSDDQARSAPMQ